jgi:hypothetical protein
LYILYSKEKRNGISDSCLLATMNKDIMTPMLGGALAGLISDGAVHPIDTVRARLQCQNNLVRNASMYSGATDGFVKIMKHEGPLSLWRGFGAVFVGTIPGHALYFAGYETAKRQLSRMSNRENDVAIHLASGLVANFFGSMAWIPTVMFRNVKN